MEPWNRETLLEHMSNFDVSDEAGQLVFADYLEENGQDGWANLLRKSYCRLEVGISRKFANFLIFRLPSGKSGVYLG